MQLAKPHLDIGLFRRDVDASLPRPGAVGELLATGLGATGAGVNVWRVGTTLLRVVHETAAQHGAQRATGFRYLTVQVTDVNREHKRLLALGWQEGMSPVKLGDAP